MRGIGQHVPPINMQSRPEDNTSKYCIDQINAWSNEDPTVLIHTEIAREIASWYQSSGIQGHNFSAFASSGKIFNPGLQFSILREIDNHMDGIESDLHNHDSIVQHNAGVRALLALMAYVSYWSYLPIQDLNSSGF